MRRILIVGCSGAGKTTLALALGRRLGLEVVHLDREFWQPGWVQMERPEFLRRLEQHLAGEAWVIDGNYDSTLEQRLTRADTAIFLDFSRWRCLTSVLRRTIRYFGRNRPDMNVGCPERIDWEFTRWIWQYREVARPAVLGHLDGFRQRGGNVVILHTRTELRNWLDTIRSQSSEPALR